MIKPSLSYPKVASSILAGDIFADSIEEKFSFCRPTTLGRAVNALSWPRIHCGVYSSCRQRSLVTHCRCLRPGRSSRRGMIHPFLRGNYICTIQDGQFSTKSQMQMATGSYSSWTTCPTSSLVYATPLTLVQMPGHWTSVKSYDDLDSDMPMLRSNTSSSVTL